MRIRAPGELSQAQPQQAETRTQTVQRNKQTQTAPAPQDTGQRQRLVFQEANGESYNAPVSAAIAPSIASSSLDVSSSEDNIYVDNIGGSHVREGNSQHSSDEDAPHSMWFDDLSATEVDYIYDTLEADDFVFETTNNYQTRIGIYDTSNPDASLRDGICFGQSMQFILNLRSIENLDLSDLDMLAQTNPLDNMERISMQPDNSFELMVTKNAAKTYPKTETNTSVFSEARPAAPQDFPAVSAANFLHARYLMHEEVVPHKQGDSNFNLENAMHRTKAVAGIEANAGKDLNGLNHEKSFEAVSDFAQAHKGQAIVLSLENEFGAMHSTTLISHEDKWLYLDPEHGLCIKNSFDEAKIAIRRTTENNNVSGMIAIPVTLSGQSHETSRGEKNTSVETFGFVSKEHDEKTKTGRSHINKLKSTLSMAEKLDKGAKKMDRETFLAHFKKDPSLKNYVGKEAYARFLRHMGDKGDSKTHSTRQMHENRTILRKTIATIELSLRPRI